MERSGVVARQQRKGLRLQDRYLVVVAGEGLEVVSRCALNTASSGLRAAAPSSRRTPDVFSGFG
jgi:hypothetical protein